MFSTSRTTLTGFVLRIVDKRDLTRSAAVALGSAEPIRDIGETDGVAVPGLKS